jgi:tetratricopeptide (TPR) repeat protein
MEHSPDAVDVKRIAKQAYENAVTETDFAYEIHVLAIDCLLLSGASDEASRAARELLLRRPTFSNRWYKYYLEYLANPTQAEEERILQKAGPFRESRTWAHYAIAMVALSSGDREKAIEYFTSVRDTSLTDWWFPCWASAFLNRLEENRKWPSWIP